MRPKHLCGFAGWHPEWLQKFANVKTFLIIYGLLGMTQGMAFFYFNVTLTTIEKRFKIPSGTTGIILSGNELSQIMLSLILSYVGGQRNRPKWISWGMIFCSMSCFILATPHFIYGAGDEALSLTQEYFSEYHNSTSVNSSISHRNKLCLGAVITESCDELFSMIPLVLLYLSQFVLGIGQTLYFSLGQPYIDDNSRRTSTPMMLAYAMSIRMCGPVAGYGLGYLTLKLYIDPTKTPLIDANDPRWLGAWWIGWIFLGIPMLIFALLIRMFPQRMEKREIKRLDRINEKEPLNEQKSQDIDAKSDHLPKIKDFPKALTGLLKNKILIFHITSIVFYVLGSTGYILFLSKYIEVQFNKSPSEATILTGPLTIAGTVTGLLVSGLLIKRYQPGPRKLFFWNVVVGASSIAGLLSYMFLSCDHSTAMDLATTSLTSKCNMNCNCDNVTYSPVCSEETGVTFYSPCHAACNQWDNEKNIYSKCECATESLNDHGNDSVTFRKSTFESNAHPYEDADDFTGSTMMPGPCLTGCGNTFYWFTLIMFAVNWMSSTSKIGSVLLILRAVAEKDKAFSQGLALMLVSLFAYSPGPIIYGYIIDSTCLVWNYKCESLGNCQLYDADKFRYSLNITSISLTFLGVLFDLLVWRHAKNINLYSEPEKDAMKKSLNLTLIENN